MAKYQAIRKGYANNRIQPAGVKFDADFVNRKTGKPADPSWAVRIDGKPAPKAAPVAEPTRDVALVDAMRGMLKEDPNRQNNDLWIGDGSPQVTELEKRTGLTDITAAERDAAWKRVMIPPPSGKTPIK